MPIEETLDKQQPIKPTEEKFFISLATKGVHSFVMLGTYQDGKPTINLRVGKGVYDPKEFLKNPCRSNCNLIFNHEKSQLYSEPLNIGGHVYYSSFDIESAQYENFYCLICNLKKFNNNEMVKRFDTLSINNTCRHTAIDLIAYTQNTDAIRDVVSSIFFKMPHLSDHFDNGIPDNYFYVFPLPPTAYKDDYKKMKILKKIYHRMENLVKKDPNGENTIAKFNALKTLYQEQAGFPSDTDISSVLESIKKWKNDNYQIISRLRAQSFLGKFFTRQSSTITMANDLEKSLTAVVQHFFCKLNMA